MKVSLTAYIPVENFDACLEVLIRLPDPLKPLQYASGERMPKAETQMVSDNERFASFVKQNPTGFMLVNQKLRYNFVRRSNNSYFLITVDAGKKDLPEDFALSVISALCAVDVAFAFVCEESEYYHRNRVFRTFGDSNVEAWIGRELKRYLPGLYWITIISRTECDQRAWNFSDFPRKYKNLNISEKHLAMQLYDRADDWNACEIVDDYCYTHSAFFSKRQALMELNVMTDHETFCQCLRRWP